METTSLALSRVQIYTQHLSKRISYKHQTIPLNTYFPVVFLGQYVPHTFLFYLILFSKATTPSSRCLCLFLDEGEAVLFFPLQNWFDPFFTSQSPEMKSYIFKKKREREI